MPGRVVELRAVDEVDRAASLPGSVAGATENATVAGAEPHRNVLEARRPASNVVAPSRDRAVERQEHAHVVARAGAAARGSAAETSARPPGLGERRDLGGDEADPERVGDLHAAIADGNVRPGSTARLGRIAVVRPGPAVDCSAPHADRRLRRARSSSRRRCASSTPRPSLPGVRLGLVSQDPLEKLPARRCARKLAAHWRVDDGLDPAQLAARGAGARRSGSGRVDRLLGTLEQLQVPLAEVRDALGIPGMGVEAAHNFRDKSRMKDVLRARGPALRAPPAGGDRATRRWRLRRARSAIPIVVKPPAGAGARNTFRVDDAERAAAGARGACRRSPATPVLLEEFIVGDEHSFDTVCVDGRPGVALDHRATSRRRSTCCETRGSSGACCCRARSTTRSYDDIRAAASARARRRSGMDTGLTHMEWFRRTDGSVAISEVGGAAARRAVHDADLVRARLRLLPRLGAAHGVRASSTPPDAQLRGRRRVPARPGRRAACSAIHGLDEAQRELGDLVVEAKLPQRGPGADAASYEGEGYVIVRHPETAVVEQALRAPRLADPRRAGDVSRAEVAMNVLMLSPGYPPEMPFFTRGLAQVGARVHRRRRPARAARCRRWRASASPPTSRSRGFWDEDGDRGARCASWRARRAHRPRRVPVGAGDDPRGAPARGARRARA